MAAATSQAAKSGGGSAVIHLPPEVASRNRRAPREVNIPRNSVETSPRRSPPLIRNLRNNNNNDDDDDRKNNNGVAKLFSPEVRRGTFF